MGSSISWDPWPRPVARAAVGTVRSVHRSAKMAPRRRFGAFVYTVAPLARIVRAAVGTQQCTQIDGNGLSGPFWGICVHCCAVGLGCGWPWDRNSVHKWEDRASWRRFGAFVYTVATRVTIRIATRAAPGGTSASTTMACRRRPLAGPSRLGGKTGSARVALPLAASSPRRQPTRTHEASRKTAICTRRIARGKLLPLYHARDRVEKVFEIAKQGGKALPVCVRSEETLGGHLLMCLVATAATRMMPDVPASRRTSPAVESMPGIPRERHATGRDGRLAATEPVRKTSEAHGAFGIRCPDTIGLPVVG